MTITSTAFQHNEYIPSEYTCDGINHNPPLTFSKVPKEAKSLVLIVEDPDAPSQEFTHWLVYNIPPATIQILENQVPLGSTLGMTDFGKAEYGGPCPQSGTHRYFFGLYALDTILDLPEGASKEKVQEAMKDHIIESAELIGLYKKGGS
jgi:Raf kinase inhibitor-like YbhB/YbcL family protein